MPTLFRSRSFAVPRLCAKIFDGVETNLPTFHGVVVRTDFAEKYPEVVVAYLKALMAANAWLRDDPKLAAEKIQEWTGINKEVVYIFLGPSGNMTQAPAVTTTRPRRGELYAVNLLPQRHVASAPPNLLLDELVGDRDATLWVVEGNARARARSTPAVASSTRVAAPRTSRRAPRRFG